ncbi:MAG: RNA polymerase sigma factor [bacterium]
MLNDDQLIKKAQGGDMSAFEQLVHRYDRQVLNIAASFRNNVDDAKDIYQEVFLRVYKGLKNFQSKSEFSTWLYRITTNVCISFHTNKSKHIHQSINNEIGEEGETLAEMIPSESRTDEMTLAGDVSKYLSRAIDNLSGQQKMVVNLKFYHGYKIKEIAEMMNCNEGTVKRYLFNATNKLKVQLGFLNINF